MNSHRLSPFFKALCDETRIQILTILAKGEMNVGDLVNRFNMTQPTISHHLSILRQAGIVNIRKEGKQVYYTVNCCCVEDCCADFFNLFGFSLTQKKPVEQQ